MIRRLSKFATGPHALPYDEPWGMIQPTRHALGALQLDEAVARSGVPMQASYYCRHSQPNATTL